MWYTGAINEMAKLSQNPFDTTATKHTLSPRAFDEITLQKLLSYSMQERFEQTEKKLK